MILVQTVDSADAWCAHLSSVTEQKLDGSFVPAVRAKNNSHAKLREMWKSKQPAHELLTPSQLL